LPPGRNAEQKAQQFQVSFLIKCSKTLGLYGNMDKTISNKYHVLENQKFKESWYSPGNLKVIFPIKGKKYIKGNLRKVWMVPKEVSCY
jgi:hypothetical protein